LLAACLCDAALSWDGSYYLLRTLNDQAVFVPNYRFYNVVLGLPTLLASYVTPDLSVLRAVFGLTHVFIPFAALVTSWLIVRKAAPALFVWAALGIALVTLPGQFGFIFEGVQVAQLFWPVLLAILLRLPRRHLPLTIVLVGLVFVSHPTASAFLGFGAVVAVMLGVMYPADRRKMFGWAIILFILAALRFAGIHLSSSDTDEMSISAELDAFRSAVNGLPLVATLAVWCGALLVLVTKHADRSFNAHAALVLGRCALACLVAAGVVLLLWARDVTAWQSEQAFRVWALPLSLPLMVLAVWEATWDHGGVQGEFSTALLAYRTKIVRVAAVIFTLTLCVQGRAFATATDNLRTALDQGLSPCVSMNGLPSTYSNALNFWSLPAYAAVIQDSPTRVLVLPGDGCVSARLGGHPQLIPFYPDTTGQGWLHLDAARARLAKASPCWYALYPNWEALETDSSGWLRWNGGAGQLRIYLEQPGLVTVSGQLTVIRQQGSVSVSSNGALVEQTAVRNGWVYFTPMTLRLHAGANVVRFTSSAGAAEVGGRLLSVAVRNLSVTLVTQPLPSSCPLQS